MNLKSIHINASSMLKGALLLSVSPQYSYVNGVKSSDTPTGYKYQCVMPAASYEKVNVVIEGAQLLDSPSDGPVPVIVEGASMSLWQGESGVGLSCKATGIKLAGK